MSDDNWKPSEMKPLIGVKPVDARHWPLDTFDLSVRAANAMQKAGIETLGELAQHTEQWLLANACTRKTLVELRKLMERETPDLRFREPLKGELATLSIGTLQSIRGGLMAAVANSQAGIEKKLARIEEIDRTLEELRHADAAKDQPESER